MKKTIFFLILFISVWSLAQTEINLCLTDANNEAIAFAELGIVGLTGTISDIDGNVKWHVNDSLLQDTIVISCLGYQPKKMKISNLLQKDTISLYPKTELIQEVIIKGAKYIKKRIGTKRHKKFLYDLRYPSKVATVIYNIDSSLSYVWKLNFFVKEIKGNPKLRIRLFSIDSITKYPDIVLNNKDIIYKVKKKGWNSIELKKRIELPQSGLICSFQILSNQDGIKVCFGGHISKNNRYKNKILDSFAPYVPWKYYTFNNIGDSVFLTLAVTIDILQEEENISFFKRIFKR